MNFEQYYQQLIAESFTPEQILAMREWIKDCQWGDMSEEDIDELSDEEIIRGVNKHYDGGTWEFLRAL